MGQSFRIDSIHWNLLAIFNCILNQIDANVVPYDDYYDVLEEVTENPQSIDLDSSDVNLVATNVADERLLNYLNRRLNSSRLWRLNDRFHSYRRRSMIVITNEVNELAVIIAYLMIVVVSLIGNSLVVKIAFSGRRIPGRTQRARTTTDVLIGSLSFSDLVMTIFNIPFNLVRLLLPHWPFGKFLCYGVPFVQTACVYVSTFTMAAIALHRWRMVTYPTTMISNKTAPIGISSPFRQSRTLRRIVAFVWIISLGLAAPTVIFNTLKTANVNGHIVIRCRVEYPPVEGINISLVLSVAIFLTQYLIPLMITGILYLKIAAVIHRQSEFNKMTNTVLVNFPQTNQKKAPAQQEPNSINVSSTITITTVLRSKIASKKSISNEIDETEKIFPNNQEKNSCESLKICSTQSNQIKQRSTESDINRISKRQRQLEQKRRRILMLSLVVAVFALCWLPLNLYHLIIDLGLGTHRLNVFLLVSLR